MSKLKTFLLMPLCGFSLTTSVLLGQPNTKKEPSDVNRAASYHQFSLGYNRPVFRDLATSPLFFSGNGLSAGFGLSKRSSLKERLFEINTNYSFMQAQIPGSDFLQTTNSSQFFSIDIRYQRLWKIERWSTEKTDIKFGGALIVTQNLRGNTALQNNGNGRENISNLMVSSQFTRDISRHDPKKLNLLIFRPTLQPAKRELRFLLNGGVLNLNYRPGYAYLFHEPMGNADQEGSNQNVFSLNGWRFSTEFEFIKFLANGNARSWSYRWDAAHAPGRFEPFQMASHQIRYTYFFQTK